jgi:6-phosphogluconate dehydrogenase
VPAFRERNLLLLTKATATEERDAACPEPGRIPVPGFSVSLAYYDSYRRERLPANLIQALRDCFGAQTYERLDKPGAFHTDWFGPPA